MELIGLCQGDDETLRCILQGLDKPSKPAVLAVQSTSAAEQKLTEVKACSQNPNRARRPMTPESLLRVFLPCLLCWTMMHLQALLAFLQVPTAPVAPAQTPGKDTQPVLGGSGKSPVYQADPADLIVALVESHRVSRSSASGTIKAAKTTKVQDVQPILQVTKQYLS